MKKVIYLTVLGCEWAFETITEIKGVATLVLG